MPSRIIALRNAVASSLNNAPDWAFSQPFVAEARFLPDFDLKRLDTLRVDVVPHGQSIERLHRNAVRRDPVVHVGVLQRLGPPATADAQAEALMTLTEEIAEFFGPARPGGIQLNGNDDSPSWRWMSTAHGLTDSPLYAPGAMREGRLFLSIIAFTFAGDVSG